MKKALLLIALITGVSLLSAQPPHQGENKSKDFKIENILQDLTPEQKVKLKEIAVEMKAKSEPVRAKLLRQKQELETMMNNPDTPEKSINDKIEEIGKSKTELEKIRFEHKRQCDAILTKSQQETLKSHIEAKKAEMKGNHRNGCPPSDF